MELTETVAGYVQFHAAKIKAGHLPDISASVAAFNQ